MEAFRIDPYASLKESRTSEEETTKEFAGFKMTAGPVKVDEKTAKKLMQTLSHPDIYGWDFRKGVRVFAGGRRSLRRSRFHYRATLLLLVRRASNCQ